MPEKSRADAVNDDAGHRASARVDRLSGKNASSKPKVRAIGEDDDGYDPYVDYRDGNWYGDEVYHDPYEGMS